MNQLMKNQVYLVHPVCQLRQVGQLVEKVDKEQVPINRESGRYNASRPKLEP